MNPERLPPHDIGAEEAVLGSLLIDGAAVARVADSLNADDFFRDRNRWIYDACIALYGRGIPLNEITVAHELATESGLDGKNRLEEIGGPAYLSYLISSVPTSVYITHYAEIVSRTALMRRLITTAGEIAALGYEGGSDGDAVLDQAEERLFRLRKGQGTRDFIHIRQVIDEYLADDIKDDKDELPRIPTGYPALDALLGGLHRSDLIILAARPGVGKTSLALGFAHHAATNKDIHARVAIFSLEMSKEQLVERLLSSESGVDSMRLRLGRQSPAEQRRILDAAGKLSTGEIYIDDSPMTTVMELRSKVRRLHIDLPVDLVVVDYLQLIQGHSNNENRVAQISLISRSLKTLARELHVPVVALSQLSRAVETRSPHIPMLSDLRESGSLEQDADVVLFIYREDMYYTEDEWDKHFPGKNYPQGIAKVMVAKHRNGPTGERALFFRESLAKFESLAYEWEDAPNGTGAHSFRP